MGSVDDGDDGDEVGKVLEPVFGVLKEGHDILV